MRCSTLAIAALLLLSGRATAQAPIRYEMAFPNAAHHEAEITVSFPDLGPGPLEIRMSRTSPGRYALHEFAKNLYNFRAKGLDGRWVEVTRPDLHQWTVLDHGGEVTVHEVPGPEGARAIASREDMDAVLEGRRPGDTLEVRFWSRGVARTATLVVGESEALSVTLDPRAGSEAARFLATWKEGIR